MGRDKATLELAGVRLVDRVAGCLRQALGLGARLVVSGKVPGFECVGDRQPGLGPVGGIESVLRHLLAEESRPRWILAVPVDMPFLSADSLRTLVREISDDGTGDGAAFAGFELPVALAVSVRVADAALRVAEEAAGPRARSVAHLIAELEIRRITAPKAELQNLNRPEDLPCTFA